MHPLPLLAACALLASCGSPEPASRSGSQDEAGAAAPVLAPEPANAGADPRWEASASGEGDGLRLVGPHQETIATLFCPSGRLVLIVNVPSFRPVGSEERMSLGAGDAAIVLVADTAGDKLRGGVTGEAAVPPELAAIVGSGSGIGVNYGSQNIGPLPPVQEAEAGAFVTGCSD